jgi:triosephosphate isomerase
MERKTVIAGNWKMYKSSAEAVEFIQELAPLVISAKAHVFLGVPFISIGKAAEASRNTNIIIGAQNMHFEEEGAFTGEISSLQLRSEGADFVILGHSERRQIFKETDTMINKKVVRALKDDLIPILCIGETEEHRDQGKTADVLEEHLINGLKNIPTKEAEKIIIAYEPVWAIGTGKVATPEMAQKEHQHIRKVLGSLFGKSVSEKIPILYGGSVKPTNIKGLIEQKDIDGALVGGASLKAESFAQIVNAG